MGEAGLVRIGMTLLGGIAVGAPDVGAMPSIMVRTTIAPRVGAAVCTTARSHRNSQWYALLSSMRTPVSSELTTPA